MGDKKEFALLISLAYLSMLGALTSSAGATGCVYSHLYLEDFTTPDREPVCLCRVIHQPLALQL